MSLPTSANKSAPLRPSLSLSLLAAALGFSQVSCGAPELSCGTGDKIVFGYQALPSGLDGRENKVSVENGAPYLYVDGSCGYWVRRERSSHELIRQGTLTAEQLSRFNREVMTRDWSAIRDAKPVPFAADWDGSPQYIWRDETVATCEAGCPEVVSSAISATEALMDDLWEGGEPLPADSPLRWRVREDASTVAINPVFEWSGTSSLAAQADTATFGDLGDAPSVSGGDAELVRGDLTTLMEGYEGLPYSLLYLEGGVRYRVNARDALPFEDERGLVRPPGIDWGVE